MNYFLFAIFPYIAISICVVGSIYRYKMHGFKYSSLSSQFLESKSVGTKDFKFNISVAAILFHVGVISVLLIHVIAFTYPSLIQFGGLSLIIFEVIAIILGFCALIGLVILFVRRLLSKRLKSVTTKMDIVVELLLIFQFVLGLWTAIDLRWGSIWFISNMTPYLRSLATLNPQIEVVSIMPHVLKTHVIGAFLIIMLIPFSRLVHFLVLPFKYIVRPYQLTRWYYNKSKIRDSKTPWSQTKSKNS